VSAGLQGRNGVSRGYGRDVFERCAAAARPACACELQQAFLCDVLVFGPVSQLTTENRAEFDDLLAGAGEKLVVVDFHAAWCGPCQKIKPIFNGFAQDHPKVLFCKVDTDLNAETAKACKVTVMPTFQFYKNRRLVHTVKGADAQSLHDAIVAHGRDKWDVLSGGRTLSGLPR